jgi:hypothetical protein
MPEMRDDLREGASRWWALLEPAGDDLRFLGRDFDASSGLDALISGRCVGEEVDSVRAAGQDQDGHRWVVLRGGRTGSIPSELSRALLAAMLARRACS